MSMLAAAPSVDVCSDRPSKWPINRDAGLLDLLLEVIEQQVGPFMERVPVRALFLALLSFHCPRFQQ
ncbi:MULTISPECIES: hypothetical protein [Cupriavidus]|jgi:hypothetical protein|uniref:Uncharacterized protein n=1 Tax=Cupriavidus metallidurans TaxID=119219 RepID=A0A482IZX8_9BURK|nr:MULTISPECIES: hypothetical protein [Cupriavidus]QBP13183.1 hypothetical protein DDF84_026465 [Cupriavidus metallidurans]